MTKPRIPSKENYCEAPNNVMLLCLLVTWMPRLDGSHLQRNAYVAHSVSRRTGRITVIGYYSYALITNFIWLAPTSSIRSSQTVTWRSNNPAHLWTQIDHIAISYRCVALLKIAVHFEYVHRFRSRLGAFPNQSPFNWEQTACKSSLENTKWGHEAYLSKRCSNAPLNPR